MKVFFLGTGAAEGLPALFCNCEICTYARQHGGYDRRFRSGIFIDDSVRIDLCPDALAQLHAYPHVPLNELDYLLFTHSHDDHFASRELQYLSPNFAPCRKNPLTIWGSEYIIQQIRKTMDSFFEPIPVNLCLVEPFHTYTIGRLAVTPITAYHKIGELCLNFLFTEPSGTTLLYASDTGWYREETWEFLDGRRIDGVVLECGLGSVDHGYDGHMSISGCIAFRDKLIRGGGMSPDVPFFLTHISHTGLMNHEQLSELANPHQIQVAYDGLEFTI